MNKSAWLCCASLVAVPALEAPSASAQVVDGPPAACQNFDGMTRFYGPNGTAEGSDLALANEALTFEEPLPAALPLLVGFGLSQAQQLRLSAAVEGGDALLSIRNANGQLVAHNDDSENGLDSLIEAELSPGNYCAVLAAYGTEELRIRSEIQSIGPGQSPPASAPQSTAAGGCFNGATTVDLGVIDATNTALRGATAVDDQPYLSFQLETESNLRITAENQSADPVLSLYDTSGELIDENDDSDGLNAQLIVENLQPGEWCLEVAALSDSSLSILVQVQEMSHDEVAREAIAQGQTPPLADDIYPWAELGLLTSALQDTALLGEGAWWGQFSLQDHSLVEIDAPDTGVDPVLRLFDINGSFLAENDDFGETYGARIYAKLDPGTYWVTVYPFDQNNAGAQATIPLSLTRYIQAE